MTLQEAILLHNETGKKFYRPGITELLRKDSKGKFSYREGHYLQSSYQFTEKDILATDWKVESPEKVKKGVTLYRYTYKRKYGRDGNPTTTILQSNWTSSKWDSQAKYILKTETRVVEYEVEEGYE